MNWLGHVAGLDNPSGAWYLFWSGLGSWLLGVGVVGTLVANLYHSLRKHNCHTKGCLRIGRHTVEGTNYMVCRSHHPEGAPSHQQILDAHQATRPAPNLPYGAPMATFTFLVGCADCTNIAATFTDPDRRQRAMDGHLPGHRTAHFVAATEHPAAEAGAVATFAPGDEVTFHGSTTDQAADHQPATVTGALRGTDQDGRQVDGYLIQVPIERVDEDAITYNVFVSAAALVHGEQSADAPQ